MATKEPPIGAIMMSVLTVISVAVIMPMAIGGTISAAIALAGEDPHAKTPDDANGFRTLNSTVAGTLCSSWPTATQTYVSNEFNVNWTQTNGFGSGCSQTGDDWVRIQIPATVLPDPSNLTFSRIDVEIVSRNQYANSLGSDAHFNMTMTINGTEVFDKKKIKTATYLTDSSSNKRYYLNASIDLDGVDELKYRVEAGDCYPNCTVVLNISGYHSDNAGAKIPTHYNGYKIRVSTYVTDIEAGNFVLTIMPYMLAGINFMIALAATPYWNPVAGATRNRMRAI